MLQQLGAKQATTEDIS